MGIMDRLTKKDAEKEVKETAKTEKKKAAPRKKAAATKEKKEKEVVATEAATEKKADKKADKKIENSVIIRPVVTEKSALMQSSNKYTFIVKNSAKKEQVKQAVKAVYGVEPVAVNVVNVQGRRLRGGTGKRSDFKKAVVTLPAGKSISVHAGV